MSSSQRKLLIDFPSTLQFPAKSQGELTFVYRQHIQSDKWRKFCLRIYRRAIGQCEAMGNNSIKCMEKATEVHHLTYDRLGDEREDDCIATCHTHHVAMEWDKVRARNAKRVDGYMRSKYGEYWSDRITEEEAFEDFQYWRERSGERVVW